ncbi:MFS transporter [Planomonospora sp. ID82291]|uniref:MFS transporter n=1 Tax=Planomonospora sp. ID82291 TaxID=2738136 RepID=UPI0027DC40A1|nr:MFS transporter [Planomonospora sp. ID82291]
MAADWERARRSAGEASRRVGRAAARAGRAGAQAGRAAARAARGTGRAAGRAGRGAADATLGVGRAARRLTHAQGAGRTGLGQLIELTAAHSAGDALVTAALAGTLFKLPVNEARGQVALYLLITMIPFVVVAPFVGPVLDRFRSGRRFVMAGTLFGRGLLCFAMAAAVAPGDVFTIFPAALAVLVLSKAYNVSRAAIMPSVLPADIALVTANARVALFALVSAGVAVPLGAGVSAWLGAEWVLRAATVLFLVQGVLAVRLPRHVDSPDLDELQEGEERPPRWRTMINVGPVVAESMLANVAIRFHSGFLLFYLLFLVQEKKLPGMPPAVAIGVLALAAGAGGLAGAGVASWARSHSPQVIVLATLALSGAVTVVAAAVFGLWTAVAVALAAAFSQGLGKLALDAIVQREIGEEIRSSTFGVVEAFLQIAWVVGGLIGLLLSLFAAGPGGLAAMAALLAGSLGWLVVRRRARVRARDARARAARAAAADSSRGPEGPEGSDDPGRRDPQEAPESGPAPAPPGPEAAGRGRGKARPGKRPAGTTTAVVRRGEPPAEQRTKPLTNPHG